jgi:hypothetical protein
MSDFLANLVARSFGAIPAVRPRLTSLYEPVRQAKATFRNPTETRDEDTFEVAEHELLAENKNTDDQRPKSRAARIAANGDKHDARPAQDELAAQPAVVPLPKVVREPRPAISVEGVESNEPAASARRNFFDRVPIVTAVTEPEPRLVKPVPVPPAILPATRDPQPERGRHDLLIPPKLTPEMRLSDLALSARPDRKSYGKERNPLPGSLQPSEQTVNVTIGRIEVRASKESAHSTKPSSPSPVMSLEEYLRNRARQAGS